MAAQQLRCETETALLKAIYASPTDHLPRLVYADWLSENGRGEEEGQWREVPAAGDLDLELARDLWLESQGAAEAIQADGKFVGEESDWRHELTRPYREVWGESSEEERADGMPDSQLFDTEGYEVVAYDPMTRTLTLDDCQGTIELTFAADPLANAEVVYLRGHASGEYGWAGKYGQGETPDGVGRDAARLLGEFLGLSRDAESVIGLGSVADTVSGEGDNSDEWLVVTDAAKWGRFLHFARRWESATGRYAGCDGDFPTAEEVADKLYDKLTRERAA